MKYMHNYYYNKKNLHELQLFAKKSFANACTPSTHAKPTNRTHAVAD